MTTIEAEILTTDPARPEITLTGPWKNRDADKILKAWGCELDRQELEGVANLRQGGWWHHSFPPLASTMAYAVKASKHSDAVYYLHLLCEAALASQYSLTECALLIRECMGLDPVRGLSPRGWANDWALLLITFVNAWQARANSISVQCDALGDEHFLEHFVRTQQVLLGQAHIEQMEQDLEVKKQQFRGGATA